MSQPPIARVLTSPRDFKNVPKTGDCLATPESAAFSSSSEVWSGPRAIFYFPLEKRPTFCGA